MPQQIAIDTDLRRRILDTSRHLLLTQGYQHLSMRRIARSIGYSPTSIYLHFTGKDALIHTLIEEGLERLYQALMRAAPGEGADPVERLEKLCRGYIAFGLDHPEYYEIMFMLHPAEMAPYPPEKYRRGRRSLECMAGVLAQGAEAGRLSVDAPFVAASTLWSMLHGAVALLLAGRVDASVEAEVFVEATVDRALRAFLVSPPS